jgi:hypothetical protein
MLLNEGCTSWMFSPYLRRREREEVSESETVEIVETVVIVMIFPL